MPSLYEHTLDFYEALVAHSKSETIEGKKVRVFRGKVTELYREQGISQTHYSKIRQSLINLGCMVILRQGSRDNDTVIVLYRAPTEIEFQKTSVGDLTKRFTPAMLSQRIEGLENSMGGINVKKALVEQRQLVSALQEQISELRREVGRIAEATPKKYRSTD